MSNYLHLAAVQGFDTAFELLGLSKTAAQKARTVARERAANGDVEGATRIMQAPGVVNPNSSGVPYHTLGAGGEGVAELAMKPSLGNEPVVKKTFDPKSQLYSPEIINRKAQLGPELNKNPAFAKFLGEGRTDNGTPIHYNEYVKGSPVRNAQLDAIPEMKKEYMNTAISAQRSGRELGHNLMDIRPANMLETPEGKMKVIDHMPAKPNEIVPNAKRRWATTSGDAAAPDAKTQIDKNPIGMARNALPLKLDATMGLFPNALEGGASNTPQQMLANANGNPRAPRPQQPAPQPASPQATAVAPSGAPPAAAQRTGITGVSAPAPVAPARPQSTSITGITAPAAPAVPAPAATALGRMPPRQMPPAGPAPTALGRIRR